ncbi:hypothetical protein ACTNB0_10740 [Lachnospiraceae bacterium HCP28S3_F9]
MEKIKVLCYGKKDNSIGCISDFLEVLKQNLEIQIKNVMAMSLADFMQDEIDEEELEYYEPFEAEINFKFRSKECKMHIRRITKRNNRVLNLEIEYYEEDNIFDLQNSIWFDFKEALLNLLHSNFERIYWLTDTQNQKMATDLYGRMHSLENYLREIINSYMCIVHGGDWFEKYSYEDFLNKYLKFSEWFRKSDYDLFKQIDNHLFNLEIDDIFDALKAAKKKQLSGTVKKALEEIKKREKEKAPDIANVDLLNCPSLWEEENLGNVFSSGVVGRWKNDLSKRRNMIAHNKMICRAMYQDTISAIDFFNKEFQKAEEILNRRIHSEEDAEISRIQREIEIAMNLEYCDISSDLLEEQDIIERLNETDDFMSLSTIINDRIAQIGIRIDELVLELEDAISHLDYDNFFEEDQFVGESLLREYIEFAKEHQLYKSWIKLLEKEMSVEVYTLIEPVILEYMLLIKSRLEFIKESVYFVDLECFSEGDLVRLQDFDGNMYKVSVSGWICPERGASNELYVNLQENGELSTYGTIYISYGDFEMTEDDIPIPYVEDEMVSNFGTVNERLENIVEELFDGFNKLEDAILCIEI